MQVGAKLHHRTVNVVVAGKAFSFNRRRYGRTSFTWAFMWDGEQWLDCGDPWQNVIVPRKDLQDYALGKRATVARPIGRK